MRYQREQSIVIFVLEDGGGAEKGGGSGSGGEERLVLTYRDFLDQKARKETRK